MRTKIVLTVLAGLWVVQSAPAQQTKHASELLPDSTVAYFEVRKIGDLAKEISALFKKTALSNVPFSLQKYLRKFEGGRMRIDDDLYVPALALTPEVMREVGRLGGVAGGITGIVDDDMPEFAIIVDTGKSNVPKFLVRLLFLEERFAPARKVEGVTLWSKRGDKDPDEVVFAFLPQQIILGTPKTVTDVVLRAKGKAKGKSLAETDAYQAARKEAGADPGLFACANVKNLIGLFDDLLKLQRNEEMEILRTIGRLINPNAFRALIYEATLKDGVMGYRETAVLNPNEKSPLLDLLPSKAVDLNIAKYAPKNAMMFMAISNADGESRFKTIIDLADKLSGQFAPNNPPPSAMLQKVEKQLGINIAKDVAGAISGVAFAMNDPFAMQKGNDQPPWTAMFHLVVQATDAKAAKRITSDVVPSLFQMTNRGNPVRVDQHKVNGQTVHTLSLGPGNSYVLNWGIDGKNIVFAANMRTVADALNGAKSNGLLANKKLAKRMKSIEQPIMIGSMKYFSFLTGIFTFATAEFERRVPPPPKREFREKSDCGDQPGERRNAQVQVPPFFETLKKLAAKEEPFVFSITRTKTRLSAQAEMVGLRTFVPAFVNLMVEMHFRERGGRRFRSGDRPPAKSDEGFDTPRR